MENIKRKKIGLALGGGGARGLAHVGVIRALERAGVSIDYIAGTSMGALVGGLYATTRDLDLLEETFRKLDHKDIFPLAHLITKRDGVLFRNHEIADAVEARFKNKNIEQCEIPFVAIATDVQNGDTVIMDSGPLAKAIHASIALPVMFQPVQRDKRLLMDGGFSNPVPADVVRKMGAEYVIAVDVTSQWVNIADQVVNWRNLYSVISNALSAVEYQISRQILKEADIVLRPPVLNYDWLAFDRAEDLIIAGEDEARNRLGEICDASGYPRPPQTMFDKFIDFIRDGK